MKRWSCRAVLGLALLSCGPASADVDAPVIATSAVAIEVAPTSSSPDTPLGLPSAASEPNASSEPSARPSQMLIGSGVLVHGTVVDYGDRPTEGANVRATRADRTIEVWTNASGHFEIRAPPGAHVSASKHDMLGSVTLGSRAEQTVVIKMAQMPM